MGITIDWNCDLDWHVQHCKPIYEFHGLYEEKKLSQGFNFRCLPGPHQCTLPWSPMGFSTPRTLGTKQLSLGGEQRSLGSSCPLGIGQAGSQQGAGPWWPTWPGRVGEIADIKSQGKG